MSVKLDSGLQPTSPIAKPKLDVDAAFEDTLQALERYSSELETASATESPWLKRRDTAERALPVDGLSGDVDNKDVAEEHDELPSWSELTQTIRKKCKLSLQQRAVKVKAIVTCAVTLVAIGLIPWPYNVKCNVVCEPVVRRYVAAPFDARLLKSHVVVGQTVAQGDLLATLDGGELRNELAAVRAKLAQSNQRHSAALSQGDHSKSEFERLEIEHLRYELEILETRQQKLEIRSPIDGVVVTGDLERAEGITVSLGDNLFEIASLDRLIAEIAIPEQKVTHVAEAQPVRVWLDAASGLPQRSSIGRIHQRSELRDNASVYVAQAELANEDRILRPGMNGTAAIQAGHRPIAWLLFHRPYHAIRQRIGW